MVAALHTSLPEVPYSMRARGGHQMEPISHGCDLFFNKRATEREKETKSESTQKPGISAYAEVAKEKLKLSTATDPLDIPRLSLAVKRRRSEVYSEVEEEKLKFSTAFDPLDIPRSSLTTKLKRPQVYSEVERGKLKLSTAINPQLDIPRSSLTAKRKRPEVCS